MHVRSASRPPSIAILWSLAPLLALPTISPTVALSTALNVGVHQLLQRPPSVPRVTWHVLATQLRPAEEAMLCLLSPTPDSSCATTTTARSRAMLPSSMDLRLLVASKMRQLVCSSGNKRHHNLAGRQDSVLHAAALLGSPWQQQSSPTNAIAIAHSTTASPVERYRMHVQWLAQAMERNLAAARMPLTFTSSSRPAQSHLRLLQRALLSFLQRF
jgi:hypothetical protein